MKVTIGHQDGHTTVFGHIDRVMLSTDGGMTEVTKHLNNAPVAVARSLCVFKGGGVATVLIDSNEEDAVILDAEGDGQAE